MDKLKQWVALTVAGCLVIMGAGWFLLVSPKRSEAAELRDQAAQQTSANAQLQTQLQVLKAKAKDLPKEQAKLAAVAAKIPDNPALPGLIRSLLDAATSSGVELVSIAPGEPTAAATTAAATKPAAPAGAAPAAAAPKTPTAARAATAGSAGLLTNIPVAINVVGDYFEVQQFMAAAEELPRALRVQQLSLAPGAGPTDKGVDTEDGRSLTTTLNGFVFMAANRPSATAASVPGAAAPAAAAPAAAAPAPAGAPAATTPAAPAK